jgi:Holliday junction resolvase-like predicted endonuclease
MFSTLPGKSVNLQHPSLTTSKAFGEWSKRLDCDWLESHGLELLERNYLSKYGEIDLFMTEHRSLVFVEVRYRKILPMAALKNQLQQKNVSY